MSVVVLVVFCIGPFKITRPPNVAQALRKRRVFRSGSRLPQLRSMSIPYLLGKKGGGLVLFR